MRAVRRCGLTVDEFFTVAGNHPDVRLGVVALAAVVMSISAPTSGASDCREPLGSYAAAWSPLGGQLAVSLTVGGPCRSWRAAVSVPGEIRWLDTPGGVATLSWAPDGRRLATGLNQTTPQIVVHELDGVSRPVAVGTDPAWSPNGAAIAYATRTGGVALVAPDGSLDRQVALGAHPAWSPDARRLAYDRDGSVYAANADGGSELAVGAGTRPMWSPDGSWIGVDRAGVAVALRADSTGERILGRGRIAGWSPDGSHVVLLDRGVVRLHTLATGAVRRVAEDVGAVAPSPAWERLATVLDVGRRSEIYLSELSGARPRRVSPTQCGLFTSTCREGSDGADRIIGRDTRDVILPGAGDDRVRARGGHDRVDTAYGRDFVDAGPGNDVVHTHGNDDRLIGGTGVDHLLPGDGEDVVSAGPGRDAVVTNGDGRVDRIRCGTGLDIVQADRADRVARDCEVIRRS